MTRYIPHIRNLFLLYVITFLVVLPIICYYLPFSKLYKVFHKDEDILRKAKEYNTRRLDNTKKYFKNLNKEESQNFYRLSGKTHLDLVVVIVTVKRKAQDQEKLGYFLQTSAAMDKILKADTNYLHTQLLVCNVDGSPDNHTDASYVSAFIPTVQRFGKQTHHSFSKDRDRDLLYRKFVRGSKYEKETIDYLFCLETAYNMNSKYVIIMEDDAYPRSDFLAVVKYNIERKIHHFNNAFVYIKLYYPQKWQGFAYEMQRMIDITSIGCVGGGIFLLIYSAFGQRSKQRSIQYVYFVFGAVYFILLSLVISRPNLLELRRIAKYFYSLRVSPGCCTQAMLYSTQAIPELLRYMIGPKTNLLRDHTDIALYRYITNTNKIAYQIEPNLFYHIGMYTTLGGGRKNPEEFIFSV